jgi:DNA-binding NarL/FixJ family response regulator
MNKPSLQLICEMQEFKTGLETYVAALGYTICSNSEIIVLIDARMGTALRYLEQHGKTKPTLVITDNACSVYLQCLEAFKLEGMIFNSKGADSIAEVVALIQNNQTFCNVPKPKIRFTPRELTIARELARGLETTEIGLLVGKKLPAARKAVMGVLEKAKEASPNKVIANRTQFALWFWGQDHVLDDKTHPQG